MLLCRHKKIRGDCEIANDNEIQSMDQSNSLSNIRLTDKNLGQEIDDGITENDGGQSTNQHKMNIKSTVSLAEGNMSAKRKWKRKNVKRMAGNNVEVENRDQSTSMAYLQLSNKSLRQEIGDKLAENKGVRHNNQDMIDIETVDLTEGNVNRSMGQSHAMSKLQLSDASFRQEICDKLADNVDVQHTDKNKLDIESIVNLAEDNVNAERKWKMKKVRSKSGNNDEVKSRDLLNSMSYLQLSDKSLRQEIDDKLAENEGVQHNNQGVIEIETVNLTEGNVNQSMGRSHALSKLQLSDTSFRQKICDKLAENVDVPHTDQNKVDIESTVNLAEGNVSAKRKRKRKRTKIKAGNNDEVRSKDQSNSMPYLQLSDKSLREESYDKLAKNECVQHNNQDRIDRETVNLMEGYVNQSMGQSHAISKLQLSDTSFRHGICDKLAGNVVVQHTDQNKLDTESIVNLTEGNVSAKRRRKRKKVKSKAGNNDEVKSSARSNSMSYLQLSDQSVRQEIDDKLAKNEGVQRNNQDMIDIKTANLTEGNVNQSMGRSHALSKLQLSDTSFRQKICDKLTENVDVPHTDQNKLDIESTVNLAEGNVSAKRKRKRKRIKIKPGNNDEVKSRDQSNSMPYLQLSDKSLREESDDKLAKNECVQHTNQDRIDRETVNLMEDYVNQSMGQSHAISKLQLSDTIFRHGICDKLADNVDVQHTDQNKLDTELIVNLSEGNVSAKRKWKRKKVKSKAGNNDEVKSMDRLNSMSYLQLLDKSLRQEIDDKLAKNEGAQRNNQDVIDIETVNLTEGIVNQSMGQSHALSKLQLSDTSFRQEICDKLAENVDVTHTDQNKVDIESTVTLAKGNVSAKRKRKRKRIKRKTGNKYQFRSMDRLNLQSDNNIRQEMDNTCTEDVDVRRTDQKNMDKESHYNLVKGNMSIKCKRRRKKGKSKGKNKDEVQSMDLANYISNLQLAKNKLIENDSTAQETNFPASKEYKPCHNDHLSGLVEVSIKTASSEVLEERSEPFTGPMGLGGTVFPCESQQKPNHNQIPMEDVKFENVLNEANNGIFVADGTTSLGPSGVKEAEFLSKDLVEYPSRPLTTTERKKLLVLDVNGLLAYIVMPAPKGRKADINILRRAVFKRPFCDDFLKFCFQNFDVGIWSSRAKKVIDRIVHYLLGNLKQKLLFCWNMSHSTQSGFKTLENRHKPLVCKELRKIWESDGSKFSWKKGQYNESNTLLIDDSPFKALLNPLHTAIFPHPYHYEDKDDHSLGPGGDLRVYLEGWLKSGNVQDYVEHHPFGQSAINETNVSWQFYSDVLRKFSNKAKLEKNPLER